MDQDLLETDEFDGGKQLRIELAARGFETPLAFWAKPTDSGQWYLYLASPFVDEKGPAVAYRLVQEVLRKKPELGIDLFEIKVIGVKDSLAVAVLERTSEINPKYTLAAQNPGHKPSMIRMNGTTLAGVSMESASIYPPLHPDAIAQP